VREATAVKVGENRQALVTKNAAGGDEVTVAWTNMVAVVTEQVKLSVSMRTQISEKYLDEEGGVFVCRKGVVRRTWVDESVRLWKMRKAETVEV
jgi:hypothetical protein